MADARESFGPVAERYASSQVHGNPEALQRLIDLVRPQGGYVVDIAAGSGHSALAFAPHVDHVVAVDLTPEMTKVCLAQANKRDLKNVSAVVGRAESLPFTGGSFHGAVCRIAPHHFDHPAMFLSEVRRVVKPGGWFLLVDNVGPNDKGAAQELDSIEKERDPSHRSYLPMSLWREMLEELGFAIRHDEGVWKPIDIQEWLERMAVPTSLWTGLKDRLAGSSGPLKDYLQPTASSFRLREHLFLADNQE